MRYWALVEPTMGESFDRPGAIFRVEDDGSSVALLVAKDHWREQPALIKYVVLGESGAVSIDEERAKRYIAHFPWVGSRFGKPLRAAGVLDFNFNPDQPRDAHGLWTKGGGDEDAAIYKVPGVDGVPTRTALRQAGYEEVERVGGGSSDIRWYKSPDGDAMVISKEGGNMGNREGLNEMIGAKVLASTELPFAPVAQASETSSLEFPVVYPTLGTLGMDDVETFYTGRDLSESEKQDFVRIALFDEVVQNQDGHSGNVMSATINGEARVVPIDNSLILNGRGGGASLGNIGGFPPPAPMSKFDQYNDWRHDMASRGGRDEVAWLPRSTIASVYDKTTTDLRAGVQSLHDVSFRKDLSPAQAEHVYSMARYMAAQVDGLTTYRDTNIAWLMGKGRTD